MDSLSPVKPVKITRLPFDEQLLIHAASREATAVLPMEKWNEKFGRWVKRDSKGIAVFDKSSDHLKLKYYFDVSDTREGKYKRLVRQFLCGACQKNRGSQ
ncbi:MAG: hypothetical protein ACLUPF_14125 [Dorea sp.]